jgi:hypothetical protein
MDLAGLLEAGRTRETGHAQLMQRIPLGPGCSYLTNTILRVALNPAASIL